MSAMWDLFFHYPIGIDVCKHVWENKPNMDSHCLVCGECVGGCPRGFF